MEQLLLVLLFLPFLVGVVGLAIPKHLGLLSSLFAAFGCAIVVHLSLAPEPIRVTYEWFPQGLVSFSLIADGLALFFALLITGIGALVFYYANFFMDETNENLCYFYLYMNIFMGAMLGAVLSDNLLLFFIFWELTGLMSYLLISYHYEDDESRRSARSAFLINTLASLSLLMGIIIIGVLDQTLEISTVTKMGVVSNEHPYWFFGIMILILTGAFTKSAQFPLHFWLPDAMKAPTPVSAYLHSATMVKLGIYLLARTYNLFIDSELWLPLLITASSVTVLLGGFWALFATSLKRILAYATISQLGFFISFYGIGNPEGLQYDYIHIFNHALYKGSLFMLVGIVAHAANITEIHQLSNLWRRFPLISIIFLMSIAAMAGIPGTTGFLSKELLVQDLVLFSQERPIGFVVFINLLLGLIFKVGFSYRFFYYLFLEEDITPCKMIKRPSFNLLLAPLILSSLALFLGVYPKAIETVYHTFTIEGLHKTDPDALAIWHGFSTNLIISFLLFTNGITLFYVTKHHQDLYKRFDHFAFRHYWNRLLDSFPSFAGGVTARIHSADPQKNLRWVMVILPITLGSVVIYANPHFFFETSFSQLNLLEVVIALFSMMLIISKSLTTRLITLSLIGFYVTYYFVLKQAPDLAITQMVVEVGLLFIFVLLLSKIKDTKRVPFYLGRGVVALLSGLTVACLPFFNGAITEGDQLGAFYLQNSLPLALGHNAVNTILVDFRALDTLIEVAVIVVAAVSIQALLGAPNIRYRPSFIPTPALQLMIPALVLIALLFSTHLLIRGHNDPGGGFSGGMTLSIYLVLSVMCLSKAPLALLERLDYLSLMMWGLFVSATSGVIGWLVEGEFMTGTFFHGMGLISTPFLFDVGIFLLVFGAVTSMVTSIRGVSVEEAKS